MSVKGTFRERGQILYFSRTFVLKRILDEIEIINDQFFVTNSTDLQIAWSFRFPNPGAMFPYFGEQYREMENTVRTITGMNSNFSQR